jgi:hypothetical protein
MFEHLIQPENEIVVYETVKDRDENVLGSICIGTGYGIFRGQAVVEYVSNVSGKFNSVGILVYYEPSSGASVTVDGRIYDSTHSIPSIGDVCTCKGITYDITGVDPRPDIDGNLVGYTIRCSNG